MTERAFASVYDDLSVFQTCRTCEDAAGPVWPRLELTVALAGAKGVADE
jgi:hypothetical protein